MGKKTRIDWCDSTWNPVTGCLHGCEYCYARKISERFGGKSQPIFVDYPVLDEPIRCSDTYGYIADNPNGFRIDWIRSAPVESLFEIRFQSELVNK